MIDRPKSRKNRNSRDPADTDKFDDDSYVLEIEELDELESGHDDDGEEEDEEMAYRTWRELFGPEFD